LLSLYISVAYITHSRGTRMSYMRRSFLLVRLLVRRHSDMAGALSLIKYVYLPVQVPVPKAE
jgi:hypothetical protein